MKLFVDSADLADIETIASWGVLSGATTNPTLLGKVEGEADEINEQDMLAALQFGHAAVQDTITLIERMRDSPLDKDLSARETDPLRRLFTRSVVARRALARGTVLGPDDLALKKPGTGLPPDRLQDLVGKRLARAVAEDQLLAAEDIEGLQ